MVAPVPDATTEIVADTTLPTNPFVEGKNYVFDAEGNPKEAGAVGALVQILVGGVKKLPSELNINDLTQMKTLSKVAIFLAKKIGAPIGSRFGTGTLSTNLASEVPAFTTPLPPNWTLFNHHGGSLSTYLNNIYSFTNIIEHELGHQKNYKSTNPHIENNLSTHVDVYINAIGKTSFLKASPEYQLGVIKSLANYIWNMDRKGTYSFQEIKDKIDDFNNLFNGYKLKAPIVGGNIKFDPGKLTLEISTPYSTEPVAIIYYNFMLRENNMPRR